ncbi:MAG: hypothetical protein JWM44_1420 [Bacilli bacterium]|jgi:polar amino acid transport system substrate-binding protein|nr:hypothetical protein [Bacilli bacterium]
MSMFKSKNMICCGILATILVVLSACSGTGAKSSASIQPQNTQTEKQTVAVAPSPTMVEKGKFTYGTAATFAPFEYMKDEKFVGFDIELGQAIAKQMGLEVQIKSMNFDGLIPALNGSRVDIINSAMYIKPERAAQVDFIPYMKLGNSIVVKKGNPKGVKGMDDLSNLTVAVTRGAVEEIYTREQNDKLKKAGKPEINILALPTANDAILATEQGRAEAFIDSSPGAAYLMEQKPGVFEIAGTLESAAQIGIAVRKGDTEMKIAVEAALKKVVADGTYKKLMEKYNLPAEMNYFK